MTSDATGLEINYPSKKPTLMSLVKRAGFDTADCEDYNKSAGPASNPKYCYEWCFEQDGLVIFNIWEDEIDTKKIPAEAKRNYRALVSRVSTVQERRATKTDLAAKIAFEKNLQVRVVIQNSKGEPGSSRRVFQRTLDNKTWSVSSYNNETGEFVLVRKHKSTWDADYQFDDEIMSFPEGEKRSSFITHRRRERKARDQKIEVFKRKNNGRLFCEVPNCGFDFFQIYGQIGLGFAHVHHLIPLHKAPDEGPETSLDDLSVVCPNCHAMIHHNGECRDLHTLIPHKGARKNAH